MGPRSAALGGGERCTGWVLCQSGFIRTHANGLIGGFGGAPYGATKRCTGRVEMPHRVSGSMRT
eukprot:8433769-Pyramimonas_sp.AAC.1